MRPSQQDPFCEKGILLIHYMTGTKRADSNENGKAGSAALGASSGRSGFLRFGGAGWRIKNRAGSPVAKWEKRWYNNPALTAHSMRGRSLRFPAYDCQLIRKGMMI